ncbi:MAG: hypothetical protein A2408_03460 [Candidatus Yonathbacteria bacterium RIFOXYC1_FULL_52_10]|uniref:DUF192 domain-containing protein n=1 Tax=Candidatus Yonathbacteria bacterium RIFOXYD1_FULL_52_36 TaxID=1802730 RepID=A0A1G2SN25_9BACT|nr:MAG: hypothetical protein A2408_03460 [Candidatus Yonathbacteria bacterium RIFOXYC1_FULL_52_10]OHA86098.1 MAG: hypothetical protein A2591_03525 [Candidatus Yonathbacteria bacterium RIFOXYD1_FULL_52_36]
MEVRGDGTKKVLRGALGAAAIIASIAFFSMGTPEDTHTEPPTFLQKAIEQEPVSESPFAIRGVPIEIEIVDTLSTREQGLSGRTTLGEREGMLFVFETAEVYRFWMKDMMFPLDIIWIGEDWRVVDITHNALPTSYPATFAPQTPARYVLEVPAGTAKRESFAIGDEVTRIIRTGP